MFLTSMLTGIKNKNNVDDTFLFIFGVLIVYIFQAQINLKKLKSFMYGFLILFIFITYYLYAVTSQYQNR